MRVILTGGGTAGHVNPAIAIAETIKKNQPDSEFLFICSDRASDKAAELVPRAGYSLEKIAICGLASPVYSPSNLKLPFIMARARKTARKIINEFRPDVIIGTGGFASWPAVREGAAMGVPTIIHESNASPGKTIRSLASHVDRILVNFSEAASFFGRPEKTLYTGNPLIGGFGSLDKQKIRKELEIDGFDTAVLCFGGSRGAGKLNDKMLSLLPCLAEEYGNTFFTLGLGSHYNREKRPEIDAFIAKGYKNVRVVEYIYDMPKVMGAHDIVICRAGAMTISELALSGKPGIIVPSPNVADDHQLKNARALEKEDAAVLVEEKDFDTGKFESAIRELISDGGKEKRKMLSENVKKKFAKPDANRMIYEEILKVISEKKRRT